ncbi:MAG: NAD(P)-dependent oxidoreductase [Steroidobacteraceae bacterium]
MSALRAGFIGLGAMGGHMATNLARAGLLGGVWNRTPAKAEALARELGVTAHATAEDLAADVEVAVLCVSADSDVLQVGESIAPSLRPGSIVIDCSTVSAETARRMASLCAARGAGFLDCPVSGGVEGARLGTLAIMCGGEGEVFEKARPVLAAMGKTVELMGPCGHGQATKATNQILCAGVIAAVGEAMAFAKAEGLPLDKVISTLGQGAGSSWYFVHRAPYMSRGDFPAGFRVRLHRKDLLICRDMANRHGAELPTVSSVLDQYDQLIANGHGDEDISSIFRLKTRLFDAEQD